jgi:anionic cell wall polymer biosynthesis LytR-Cps2A-Psr (LCP) family protein
MESKLSIGEEVLESISEFKTIATHITALGKLRLNTEDAMLVNSIDSVILQLQLAHKQVKSKSMPISVEKANIRAANALVTYCLQIVGAKKPEWQIVAERNGWGPK